MAMVNITKGSSHLKVSVGAYLSQYAPAGWKTEGDVNANSNEVELESNENIIPDSDESNENVKDEWDEADEELTDEDDTVGSKEKTVDEMSMTELQAKAKELGLDTLIMGIRDAQKLRELLSIPDSQEVVSVIAVGYGEATPPKPKRKEVADVARFF